MQDTKARILIVDDDLSIRLSRREELPAPSPAKRGQRLVPVPL